MARLLSFSSIVCGGSFFSFNFTYPFFSLRYSAQTKSLIWLEKRSVAVFLLGRGLRRLRLARRSLESGGFDA